MNGDFLPDADKDLQVWTTNFLTTANANLMALSLTPSDIAPLTTDQTNFNTALAALNAAKQNLKSLTVAKITARKKLAADMRVMSRRIQANLNVQPTLKEALGLNPRNSPRSVVTPIQPLGLMAAGDATGFNTLKWNRNGNHPATKFQIQAKIGAATAFSPVDTVTATRYVHSGVTPGQPIVYQIVAKRRAAVSLPSNTAALYTDGPGVVLELKKAA